MRASLLVLLSLAPAPEPGGEGGGASALAAAETPSAAAVEHARLKRGLELLEQQETDAALVELEAAQEGSGYHLDDVIALYRAIGIARAFAGDTAGAAWAFERLLAIDPGHTLPYTISPKATFVFDEVRQRTRNQRAAEVQVLSEAVVPFERPVVLRLQRRADALGLISRIVIHHRLKGDAEYQTLVLRALPQEETVEVELPAVPADRAAADDQGVEGAILQVAVIGYDTHGWEVYREPSPERPLELPVGFDAPGPWYSQWWLWGLVGGGVAALTTGAITAALLWPKPAEVTASYEVRP